MSKRDIFDDTNVTLTIQSDNDASSSINILCLKKKPYLMFNGNFRGTDKITDLRSKIKIKSLDSDDSGVRFNDRVFLASSAHLIDRQEILTNKIIR